MDSDAYRDLRVKALFAMGIYLNWWVIRGLDFWQLPGVEEILNFDLKSAIANYLQFRRENQMPIYRSTGEIELTREISLEDFARKLESVEVRRKPCLGDFLLASQEVIEKNLARGVNWNQISEILVSLAPEFKGLVSGRKLAVAYGKIKKKKKHQISSKKVKPSSNKDAVQDEREGEGEAIQNDPFS